MLRVRWIVVYVALAAALGCDGGERAAPAQQTGGEPAAAQAAPPQQQATEVSPLAPDREALRSRAALVFGTLPTQVDNPENAITDAKVALGRTLYYDPRFSKNQDLSCNSCHPLDRYGADGEPTSFGHRKQRGARNSPTVYNAALQFAQFWDGRAADVEAQAKGPVLNPAEMAMASEEVVVGVCDSIPGYTALFEAAFPEDPKISYDNMARAIGAFERRLLTPSPFDAFLAGDASALSHEQVAGLQLFVDTGCTTCHQGVGVGGGMYQKLGLVRPYPTQDVGRAAITHNDADKYFFKVPSLRNVAKTAPYFHDGSLATLDEAIRTMASIQLGRDLSNDQVASIRAFLESLTGTIDPGLIARPTSPESGAGTPGPDPS